jgi:hypothetical protein
MALGMETRPDLSCREIAADTTPDSTASERMLAVVEVLERDAWLSEADASDLRSYYGRPNLTA